MITALRVCERYDIGFPYAFLLYQSEVQIKAALFSHGGANLSGSGPPDIKTREAVAGHGQDEDKKVCFGVIVNETGKPRAKGPADPIEHHHCSKDTHK